METKKPFLEMRNITKTFGSVKANQNIDLKLYAGEIHALLGENGAGKSTLMNILNGIYRPDAGEILVHGTPVSIHSPKQAVALGIGMVHQHFRLISTLSVAENVSLYLSEHGFFLNKRKMEREIAQYAEEFALKIDPGAIVWQLSVGEQQRVEIVKLLCRHMEILILDEPSAVLTPEEAREMFRTLRRMADSGKTIIFISHKLNEVLENADRITVMKNGRIEDRMLASEATVERLTKAVVGDREFATDFAQTDSVSEETVLELQQIHANNDKGLPALKNISLQIHAGEIFGIAGVAGNGQRELSEVIAGMRAPKRGKILLCGTDITRQKIKTRIGEGISFIPEDRLHVGLAAGMNLAENVMLKEFDTEKYSRHGILNHRAAEKITKQFIEAHEIKNGGIGLPVSLMSGGNQQKLLVAREVDGNPKLIVAAYPVRGLDVGAAESIHEILRAQAKKGIAVLLISEELEEIFRICHTVGVLCNGEIMGIRKIAETNIQETGRMMTGQRLEEIEHA